MAAVILMAAVSALAQSPERMDSAERERIFNEMRAYKHRFIAQELKLSKDQTAAFFPVYDEMDDRLQQIAAETRDLEKSVSRNAEATDTEIAAAAAAVYSQKQREGKVEAEYFDRYQQILSPRQLLSLKNAEKRFTQKLMRQHKQHSNRKN